MPSSSGAMPAKFIGVEHFGQAGRKIVRGIDLISGIALPSCQRERYRTLSHRRLTSVAVGDVTHIGTVWLGAAVPTPVDASFYDPPTVSSSIQICSPFGLLMRLEGYRSK